MAIQLIQINGGGKFVSIWIHEKTHSNVTIELKRKPNLIKQNENSNRVIHLNCHENINTKS
jgi:hypothetical protein